MKTLIKLSAASVLTAAFAAPALAAPTTYTVDPTHTFASFAYSHMGLSQQQSRFNNTSGTIVYDEAAKTASVEIEIDIASVDTGSDKFNEHIRSDDFFDAAKYPKATYKSKRVVFKGGKPVAVEGDLTIKDVTKPVKLVIDSFAAKEHPLKKKAAIGANGHMKIKRSEFNAGKFVPAVGDEVTITVTLEALAD